MKGVTLKLEDERGRPKKYERGAAGDFVTTNQ